MSEDGSIANDREEVKCKSLPPRMYYGWSESQLLSVTVRELINQHNRVGDVDVGVTVHVGGFQVNAGSI